jgi:hypothetical protein
MRSQIMLKKAHKCSQRCLSVICVLTFLLVGLSGSNAQTGLRARSTNTNSPALQR